jgi:hypothetical protein
MISWTILMSYQVQDKPGSPTKSANICSSTHAEESKNKFLDSARDVEATSSHETKESMERGNKEPI